MDINKVGVQSFQKLKYVRVQECNGHFKKLQSSYVLVEGIKTLPVSNASGALYFHCGLRVEIN